jgi:hypothetical protein
MPGKEPRILAGRQREHRDNMQRVVEGIKLRAETEAATNRSKASEFPKL